jgi:glycosyltransferase involved in cell wall biosynthesis
VVLNSIVPANRTVLEAKIRRSYGWALAAGWEIEVWGVVQPGSTAPARHQFRARGPRLRVTFPPLVVLAANLTHLVLALMHPRASVLLGDTGLATFGAALGVCVTGRRSRLVVKLNVHSTADTQRRRGRRAIARAIFELERMAVRAADLVVTVGASTTHFAEVLGVPADRIVQVSAAASGQQRDRTVRTVAPTAGARDRNLVLCAARLEPRKAVDVLMSAMVDVRARFPDVRLEIAGDGDERPRLERLVHELGLVDVVTFRGGLKRDAMPDYYERGTVFVLPSRGDEGLPKVVVEAALAGCALVGTDVRGTAELITPDVTGELVPPDDPRALASAIARLLEDPERATRLAVAAQQVALAHQADSRHSYDELQARLEALQDLAG